MSKAVYEKPTLEVIGTYSDLTKQFKHAGPSDGLSSDEDWNFGPSSSFPG